MDQGIQKFVEDSLLKIWSDMICLGKHFFKGCLPQLLLGPFLNTLTYLSWLLNLIERESPIIFISSHCKRENREANYSSRNSINAWTLIQEKDIVALWWKNVFIYSYSYLRHDQNLCVNSDPNSHQRNFNSIYIFLNSIWLNFKCLVSVNRIKETKQRLLSWSKFSELSKL